MNAKEFDTVVKNRFAACEKTLGVKAGEYAPDDRDRFHNFRMAAALSGESMEKSTWGMAVKHVISVRDMVYSNEEVTEAYLAEKIGDLINYALLIEGVIRDRGRVKEQMHTEKILNAPMYRREHP